MQSSEQFNNVAPNYSPEVETEKPFTRKRKENDLDGKVVCILMRPPLLSRSSTKPRGSKICTCSHSDLGEFLF